MATVVKIGKMASTNVDAYLKSVLLDVDVENGAHIVLGDMVDGDLNVYAAATPTDVTAEEVLIVEAPILPEIDGMRIDIRDPRKFINRKGATVRARHLKVGDDVTITVDGFTATPTVGGYVVPENGKTKLTPAADLSGNTLIAYKVNAKTAISIGHEYVEAYKLTIVKQA